MASVTYSHVYRRWGDVVAVNDFNLDVADKEFMVFVGPSGSVSYTHLDVYKRQTPHCPGRTSSCWSRR